MRRARRNSLFDRQQQELDAIHARYAPVDERVRDILANIRRDCTELNARKRNAGNEAQVEAFVASLTGRYGGRTYEVTRDGRRAPVAPPDAAAWEAARARSDAPCVVIERQRLSAWAVRTTRWNYLFTVPGDSAECVVLVAHYDTWRGPGADDNTTGEEILKQYLLADLGAPRRPPITHVYFFAGSEECGLVGLFSQVLLSLGMLAGNFALSYRDWGMLAVAIALLPLASYRFGVSGSREYVRTLTEDELRRIRAVVSIDSVGEGRLYIPRGTMGADFLRVLIPFGDYDSLNDLLEEAAHLHGIKYNNFLAGGTTDHVSFLEVHNGLWARLRAAVSRRGAPFLIPASALVAMRPGKASPIVFGGKIHTPNDTPGRAPRRGGAGMRWAPPAGTARGAPGDRRWCPPALRAYHDAVGPAAPPLARRRAAGAGRRAAVSIHHVLRRGLRPGAAVRLGLRLGVRNVAAVRPVGGGPRGAHHHRHDRGGDGDPAAAHDPAHSGVDR